MSTSVAESDSGSYGTVKEPTGYHSSVFAATPVDAEAMAIFESGMSVRTRVISREIAKSEAAMERAREAIAYFQDRP